jgi:hypothetical protein
MESIGLVMSVLQIVIAAATSVLPLAGEALMASLSALRDGVLFGVQGGAISCSPESCPGSQFTQIAAAWANIGYVTHSDLLHYITTTKFGLWAPLIYACAALGALIGVAINMPMRSYMWFFLGPAIYGFLIGTPAQVQGVNWVVANQAQDMSDVWRNAEVGLKNTDAVERGVLDVDGRNGPRGTYEVAYPMVFLDELFSATTNILIEWLGVYRHEGDGSGTSNLAATQGSAEGPWYLLSTLKWGMVENIVGVSARNPDFRDAFVTFLGSECGEAFKKGIDSGKYIAAGSSYGSQRVSSVFVGNNGNVTSTSLGTYDDFLSELDVTSIPTPRSLGRLFSEGREAGQFGQFSSKFDPDNAQGFKQTGRTQAIVCSEYLYTIIQQLRFEAGHSYWQLVRSSPNGLNRDQFLRTLFYGWNIREQDGSTYATPPQMNAFVKHLIMVYLLRNELLYAPQITEINQRFAPSEQSRSYSEAYVRTMGSKAKYQELYNWAVLMPHMQGILVYFLVIAYPFAAMVMVLPGHYKTFFTWVSFFAWVKLWDVGFAIVMVLERSVWAMIGNNTSMATTANMLIRVAENAGGIGVGCENNAGASGTQSRLSDLCPVPNVCSINGPDSETCQGQGLNDQDDPQAWYLLDKLLILSASADLDLANGYYIYIMAALYFAVPAVTGQIVLGAKAGAASMLNSAIGGVSGEAGKAAMTGYQHQAVSQAYANQAALGQAAEQKGYRQAFKGADGVERSFASSVLGAENQALNEQLGGKRASLEGMRANTKGDLLNHQAQAYDNASGMSKKLYGEAINLTPGLKQLWNLGAEEGGGGKERKPGAGEKAFGLVMDYGGYSLKDKAIDGQADAKLQNSLLQGQQVGHDLRASGLSAYKGNVESAARQNAGMVAWEAKNQFSAHTSAMAGIAGMNTGGLSAGPKPSDMRGMAVMGDLDRYTPILGTNVRTSNASGQAMYGGGSFISRANSVVQTNTDKSNTELKGTYQGENWMHAPISGGAEIGGNAGAVLGDGVGMVKQFAEGVNRQFPDGE